jgi:ABC-type multidrug transport system ATPase subunit
VRSPIVRRQIGYVGHECGLYHELTAVENLVFSGRMYGVALPHERARELLRDTGLEWAAHHAVGKLSQGMCRRLAIARALVHAPKLLLLDEPFASLDADGRCWLELLLQQWRRNARAVCFTSHDIGQCRALADRTVWLEHGRAGSPALAGSNRSRLRSA